MPVATNILFLRTGYSRESTGSNAMVMLPDWVASAATMAAALMTASNLGTRITGWGFVLFSVGSVVWIWAGFVDDQASLIVTNGFLLLVNLFGVWRWLGRQSRYEDGSARAAARSRHARVPTLFPAGTLVGATVKDPDDQSRGVVVDAMLKCADKSLAYVVVSEGGIGGAGEKLRVLAPDHLRLDEDSVRCNLTAAQWEALTVIEDDRWPAAPLTPCSAAKARPASATPPSAHD